MKSSLDLQKYNTLIEDIPKPFLICGPCSAESEEQVLNTALALKKIEKIKVFRAGVWKPRTRPGVFEGVGKTALAWLQLVKQQTGFLVATEVASPNHVELCLKNNIDIIWIGARTTANPFSVQEIAESLNGVDIIVMIKNPVNPDLQLWLGALERINKAGITKLAAIHRGFSAYEKSVFRNEPKWSIAIDLKSICPTLPIICDPSHIAGNRELIPLISQKALDLNMDGLMIETHIKPSEALSDANQQLDPETLQKLLSKLIIRNTTSSSNEFRNQLELLRSHIDDIDEEILKKISERMRLASQIGEYKRDNNVTILQLKRWQEIVSDRLNEGTAMGLSREFITKYLRLIHQESIRIQHEVMNKTNNK